MIPVISTKAMVRSGEVNQLAMKKFGSQMLGHNKKCNDLERKLAVPGVNQRKILERASTGL